jgi:ribose 5-phosphate isomerase B
MRTIAIACDPNAAQLKKIIMEHLRELGVEIEDYGSDDRIYANVVFRLAEAVAQGKHERGIPLCATGIGMFIATN